MTTMFEIPTLTTERLRLRAPRLDDFDAYAAYRASERTVYVGGVETRVAAFHGFCAMIGHWQFRGFGRWIIADKESDAPIGVAGPYFPEGWPEPEIAWTVFEQAEGKGIAYEAAFRARQYAYETLSWPTAISAIVPENTRSVALAQRLGAVRERTYMHPNYGPMDIWRHPAPDQVPEG